MIRNPGDFRFKLIVPPRSGIGGMPPIPPIGAAILTARARADGFVVDQDDLDVKSIHQRELLADLAKICEKIDRRDLPQIVASLSENLALSETLARIADLTSFRDFDLLGFSVNEQSFVPAVLLSAYMAQETGLPVLVGGRNSGLREGLLDKYPHITYAVRGEGEVPLTALLHALSQERSLSEVPSLEYRGEDGAYQKNARWQFDIDEVPLPDFDGLPLDHYRTLPLLDRIHLNPLGLLVLPYKISYGCPFRCAFCSRSVRASFAGLRIRPALKVVEELEFLSRRYGTKYFMFLDEAVNLNPKHLQEMADALAAADLNLVWGDTARISPMTPEMLESTQRAGCVYLNWGMESGCEKTLEAMRKKCTTAQVREVLRASHASGLLNHINLIAGFPGETDEDFQETVDFVLREVDSIDAISIVPFVLRESAVLSEPHNFGIKILGETSENHSHVEDTAKYVEVATDLSWEELKVRNETRVRYLRESFNAKKGLVAGLSNVYAKYGVIEQAASKREVLELASSIGGAGRIFRLFLGGNHLSADSKHNFIGSLTSEQVFGQLELGRRKLEFSTLILWGGEPTRRPDLFQILKRARSLRYKEICLETDARLLSYPEKMDRIVRAGVDRLIVPVYGGSSEEHDRILGTTGALAQSLDAIGKWRERGRAFQFIPVILPTNHQNARAVEAHCKKLTDDLTG